VKKSVFRPYVRFPRPATRYTHKLALPLYAACTPCGGKLFRDDHHLVDFQADAAHTHIRTHTKRSACARVNHVLWGTFWLAFHFVPVCNTLNRVSAHSQKMLQREIVLFQFRSALYGAVSFFLGQYYSYLMESFPDSAERQHTRLAL
jgi:hypothetical protein